eukprot:TRINITY_DN18824_c0_g3_i1.p1 TRINITY_DN18824_c0_g3~~TRINITY_DN18824_c0_g3_i1.p1  ORF type:complete len:413 (-),score=68.04 TRINITY_DN18824_c0_g3_i1:60-1169(-)
MVQPAWAERIHWEATTATGGWDETVVLSPETKPHARQSWRVLGLQRSSFFAPPLAASRQKQLSGGGTRLPASRPSTAGLERSGSQCKTGVKPRPSSASTLSTRTGSSYVGSASRDRACLARELAGVGATPSLPLSSHLLLPGRTSGVRSAPISAPAAALAAEAAGATALLRASSPPVSAAISRTRSAPAPILVGESGAEVLSFVACGSATKPLAQSFGSTQQTSAAAHRSAFDREETPMLPASRKSLREPHSCQTIAELRESCKGTVADRKGCRGAHHTGLQQRAASRPRRLRSGSSGTSQRKALLSVASGGQSRRIPTKRQSSTADKTRWQEDEPKGDGKLQMHSISPRRAKYMARIHGQSRRRGTSR